MKHIAVIRTLIAGFVVQWSFALALPFMRTVLKTLIPTSTHTSTLFPKHSLLNPILLALIAALTWWCGQTNAGITLLDQDAFYLLYTGGNAETNISTAPTTVSSGANVLVVMLSDKGGGQGAEPASLTWGAQTLTKAVGIDNTASTWRNATVYYLYNPVPGSGVIIGTWTLAPTDYWVSIYTLAGVNAGIAPLTGSANNAAANTVSFTVNGVPKGGWAATCANFANADGISAFDLTADVGGVASGTVTANYDYSNANTPVCMSYASELSAGTTTFTVTETGTSAQKMAFVGAVFAPGGTGALSAANTVISASPAAILANGTSTSTITVHAVDVNGVYMSTNQGAVTLSTTAGTLSGVTDNKNGSYTAILTSASTVGTTTITGTIRGSAIGHSANVNFVTRTTATLVLSSGGNPSTHGQALTFQATVSPAPVDGETILFQDGATPIGTNTLAGGLATLTISTLADGSHDITAVYAGNARLAASTSSAWLQTVTPVLSAANTVISANPTRIAANGTSTSTITVQAKDTSDNNATNSQGTVLLSTTAGSLSGVTDNGDGTYTASLTSATSVGKATISGTIAGAAIGHNASVKYLTPSGAVNVQLGDLSYACYQGEHGTAYDPALTDAVFNLVDAKDGLPQGSLLKADGTTAANLTIQLMGNYGTTFNHYWGGQSGATALGNLGTLFWGYAYFANANAGSGQVVIGGLDHSKQYDLYLYSQESDYIVSGTTNGYASAFTLGGDTRQSGAGNDLASFVAGVNYVLFAAQKPDVNGTLTIDWAPANWSADQDGGLNGFSLVPVNRTLSAANTIISANPTRILANGTSTSTITVQAMSIGNNQATNSQGTVVLSTTAGSLSAVTDHHDGTYTAILTSTTSGGMATISGTIAGAAIGHNASVNLLAPSDVVNVQLGDLSYPRYQGEYGTAYEPALSFAHFNLVDAKDGLPQGSLLTADGTTAANLTIQLIGNADTTINNVRGGQSGATAMGNLGKLFWGYAYFVNANAGSGQVVIGGLDRSKQYDLYLYSQEADWAVSGATNGYGAAFTLGGDTRQTGAGTNLDNFVAGVNYVLFAAQKPDVNGTLTVDWAPANWSSDQDGGFNGLSVVPTRPANPVILKPAMAGGSFTFSINTVASLTYTVEYKTNLNTGAWQFFQTLPGNGNPQTVVAPMTNRQSFYRFRAQ